MAIEQELCFGVALGCEGGLGKRRKKGGKYPNEWHEFLVGCFVCETPALQNKS